ncbi:MAG TPA: glycogen debranching enzyme, partial [Terrimesophilobacter sp.]|nr:glycogen debranching enzyme [Terrimesophilobacter sp.]
STPESEPLNRILLIVHGMEAPETVSLPVLDDVAQYTLLWNSALDDVEVCDHAPGTTLTVAGTSLQLFRAR